MTTPASIPNQVVLPLRVAVGVVVQGIRIRLGRSLVTLTGVVLGIAFLMSILTAQALKRAVAAEDALRETATRMYGVLVAESGSIYAKPLALVVTEPPSLEEQRLLARLAREGVAEFRVWQGGAPLAADLVAPARVRPASDGAGLARAAAAVIVIGSGPLPALDWEAVLAGAQQRLLAFAENHRAAPRLSGGATTLDLARPLPADQREAQQKAKARDRFRELWIIVISLVVTVIGISNAMLMSVTERFRDIGTMKCLGATSRFIRRLFLLEASFMGAVGGAIGVLGGAGFALISYSLLYGPGLAARAVLAELSALGAAAGLSLLSGIVLAVVAALYPAQFAANMLPAAALRTNV